jgi:hypothetical protein
MYNEKVYQLEGEEKLRWAFFPWVLEKVHRLERLIKSVQALGVTVLFKMYGDRFLEHCFQNSHAEILAIVFFFCKVELCPQNDGTSLILVPELARGFDRWNIVASGE